MNDEDTIVDIKIKAERMNALWNIKNPYQGKFPKVLCVCSAGLLRSPTIAYVLSNMGYNTRACGVYDYALIQYDDILREWADFIVFADKSHHDAVKDSLGDKRHYVLDVPDVFAFRDDKLVQIIEQRLKDIVGI